MKIKILLTIIFALGVFGGKIIAQSKNEVSSEKSESPYDAVNLRFVLDADPSPEAVGFDDPKSYWKFSYELRFLENQETALEKAGYKSFQGNSNETTAERYERVEKNNKLYNKAWKKFGIRAAKGKISKVSLLSDESRDLTIPIQLSPEIKTVLAQSTGKGTMPNFWIQIKGKIYSKTKSGLKFKQKIRSSYVCPTKTIIKGNPEWMMNTCGVYRNILNQNNKIELGASSRL